MGLRGSALCAVALVALPAVAQASDDVPARAPYKTQAEVPSECRGATARITSRSTKRSRSAILCLINDLRERVDRRSLRLSGKLSKAALNHTRDMTRRRYFAHTGPNGPTLRQRLRRVRYRQRSAGETIGFMTFPTPVDLVNAWIASRKHYRTMVSSRYRYVGIGIVARPALRAVPSGVPAATVTADFGRVR